MDTLLLKEQTKLEVFFVMASKMLNVIQN